MQNLLDLIRLLRPAQWVKNSFVFAGFLFSNEYSNMDLLKKVILTAFSFCLVSSCVYIFNDILDLESDRLHPKKKYRALASGSVSLFQAIASLVVIGIAGIALGLFVSPFVAAILATYIVLNIFYSLWLKHIVLIDVFCISAGFMLRLIAGTIGVDIPPSKWLLLCGMMITLFIGFAKRRAEILTDSPSRREVLQNYSPVILDEILAICATSAIITYSLYTMSLETIEIHNTDNLIYTVPFVIYALFRYIYLLHKGHRGEHPTRDLLTDMHIMVAVLGWASLTFYFVKLPLG